MKKRKQKFYMRPDGSLSPMATVRIRAEMVDQDGHKVQCFIRCLACHAEMIAHHWWRDGATRIRVI